MPRCAPVSPDLRPFRARFAREVPSPPCQRAGIGVLRASSAKGFRGPGGAALAPGGGGGLAGLCVLRGLSVPPPLHDGIAGRCCKNARLALREVMSLSFCGLPLGVECPSLGQVLWPTGEFPLLCQIGTSVPLLPSLLAESLLAPALDWVLRSAPRTPPVVVVVDAHPAARLHANGAPLRRQLSAMRFGRRQLHLWRERLFLFPV